MIIFSCSLNYKYIYYHSYPFHIYTLGMGLEIYISLDRIDHHIYNPFEMAIYKSWTVGETKNRAKFGLVLAC